MLFKTLKLTNFLSFGPDSEAIGLGPLNVLVGPNGAGKSNFIEALALLHAVPNGRNLAGTIRQGGGIGEWLWKGKDQSEATIEAILINDLPGAASSAPRPDLRHRLTFTATRQRFEITDERIENADAPPGESKAFFYFGYENGKPMISKAGAEPEPRGLRRDSINPEESILAQRKDPEIYPVLTNLGERYDAIRLYREWSFGGNAAIRQPERTDLPNDFLLPDVSNLAMVLNALRGKPSVKRRILEYLGRLAERFDGYETHVEGSTIQLFLQEGDWVIPATRLSDGTLRYLCLLAILLHPAPPPLIVLEEPELGLHPDILPTLAELLKGASEQTQVVVTTHSDILVDALSDRPDALVICEKVDGATRMRRLDPERMEVWLEKYSLGRLWRTGEIGGNRW